MKKHLIFPVTVLLTVAILFSSIANAELRKSSANTDSGNSLIETAKLDKQKPGKIVLGKWFSVSTKDEFSFYTREDYDAAPAKIKNVMLPPAPFTQENSLRWVRVKGIEEPAKKINASLKSYSISVPNVAYSILSISKRISNNIEYDVIEMECRIGIENKTSRAIYAYGGCYLYDEYLFPLMDSNIIKWDQNETGTMIPANSKSTIRRVSNWFVGRNDKPYPPTRIKKIDYELFLRRDKDQQ